LQSFINGVAKRKEPPPPAHQRRKFPPTRTAAVEQGPLSEADLPLLQEFIGEAGGTSKPPRRLAPA